MFPDGLLTDVQMYCKVCQLNLLVYCLRYEKELSATL
jgi:hypothetical protein